MAGDFEDALVHGERQGLGREAHTDRGHDEAAEHPYDATNERVPNGVDHLDGDV